MSYDRACGRRRVLPPDQALFEQRYHDSVPVIAEYVRECRRKHPELYAEPKRERKLPHHCACGRPISNTRQKWCLECKPGVLLENNRRYLARKRARHG